MARRYGGGKLLVLFSSEQRAAIKKLAEKYEDNENAAVRAIIDDYMKREAKHD